MFAPRLGRLSSTTQTSGAIIQLLQAYVKKIFFYKHNMLPVKNTRSYVDIVDKHRLIIPPSLVCLLLSWILSLHVPVVSERGKSKRLNDLTAAELYKSKCLPAW